MQELKTDACTVQVSFEYNQTQRKQIVPPFTSVVNLLYMVLILYTCFLQYKII